MPTPAKQELLLELRRRNRERIEAGQVKKRFYKYQDNPVAFGQEVLGDTYTDDIIKVMESVRDNPITIARSGNSTGKTHSAARVALWWYLCFPDSQVYTTAAPPENNLKRLLWGEINSITNDRPDLFTGHRVLSLNIIEEPQHFIAGVAIPMAGTEAQREAKFSGKHAPHLLFIVDEGDAVPDEIYRAIESSMSGGHCRLLVMFNPRSEQGAVYRMERDKKGHVIELSAMSHPNVVTGQNIIPGAVDRNTTVRRINEWTRPLAANENPGVECFEVPSYLVGMTAPRPDGSGGYPPLDAGWRKVEDPAFWYMVLARYPAQSETQLISKAWINDARSRWDVYVAQNGEAPPVGVEPIMGQDVAEFGKDSNVACFRYGGYVARLISWSGLDPDATADKAAGYFQTYGAGVAQVDGTGVGAGVAPKMGRHGCMAHSVKVASSPTFATEMGEFYQLRDQLWWSVREWLKTDKGAMLPPDEALIEELAIPKYEIRNGKIRVTDKARMKDALGRSPDRADALCLTFAPELEFSIGFA